MTISPPTTPRPRIVKVYDLMVTYGHNMLHQKRTVYPMIRLSGRWLANCGFAPGQRIEVIQEPQRLVIQLVPEPTAQNTAARRSKTKKKDRRTWQPLSMVSEANERAENLNAPDEHLPASDGYQFEFYPSPTEPGAYLRRCVANPR